MRLPSAPFPFAVCVLLLAVSLPGPASAQPDEPQLALECEMLISGFGELHGSGYAKLAFDGSAASALRLKVFEGYDANVDQWLDVNEARAFLTRFSEALIGRTYWGITIESVTNFTMKSDAYVVSHTSGLVNSRWDSAAPLVIEVRFEGKGRASDKVIETAQGAYDVFALAVSASTGYVFEGTICVKQRVSALALGGFTSPNLSEGKLSGVRTPLGMVLWYSCAGHVGPGSDLEDTIAYRGFSLVESSQIAFVVLVLGLFIVLRAPGRYFDRYEKLHPRKYRKFARPLISVKVLAWVLAAVMSVVYLLPFMLSFISRNVLLYGGYLYILVPAFAIGEHLFAGLMYGRAAQRIPDESTPEVKQAAVMPTEKEGELICKACFTPIDAGLDLFSCKCGANLHVGCAEKAQTCPSCGELLFPQRTRSVQCRICGETFLYTGADDAYAIQCPKCGAFQEEVTPGKNYLVIDSDPRSAFMMVRAMARSGRPAMIFTVQFPGKIRSEYDLGDIPIRWLSDSTTDIDNVNPKDLDGDAMEIVSTFLMTTKKAGVLVDGIDVLVELNGFEKVLAFVKRLNDLAAIHGSTIILTVDKNSLPPEQLKAVSDEFDEIHDYQ